MWPTSTGFVLSFFSVFFSLIASLKLRDRKMLKVTIKQRAKSRRMPESWCHSKWSSKTVKQVIFVTCKIFWLPIVVLRESFDAGAALSECTRHTRDRRLFPILSTVVFPMHPHRRRLTLTCSQTFNLLNLMLRRATNCFFVIVFELIFFGVYFLILELVCFIFELIACERCGSVGLWAARGSD